jgi:hypothetical protein
MRLRPTILYHIIKERNPNEADFLSAEKRGIPQPADPALIRYWEGISFEDTLEGARRKARRFRRLGTYIAEVAVAAIPSVKYEQSLAPGHYTVWAEPSDLLQHIRTVHPVDETMKG